MLGIGNGILTDDSAGLYVVERLKKSGVPDHVTLTAGGTGGIAIVDLLEPVDSLVVVDAFITGRNPGSVFVLDFHDGEETGRSANLGLVHGFDLSTVLSLYTDMMDGWYPETVTLVGIEALDITTFSTRCTRPVEKGVVKAADLILNNLL
ncbi:MAG: hydrogenase maturation protease [Desulfobacteraceae bacterium]